MASATSNIATTIPEIVSDVTSGQIAPVLLAPMATCGNNAYVLWPSNQTGHLEIVFRASSDNGQTFTDKVNLSNTANVDSIDPEIAASGNHVYISWWEDYGNGTKYLSLKQAMIMALPSAQYCHYLRMAHSLCRIIIVIIISTAYTD